MNKYILASAIHNDKIVDTRILHSEQEVWIYWHECRCQGREAEFHNIPMMSFPEPPKQKREPQYIPPPSWSGRVVCIETGWIFTSIAAAAAYMNGSQWALRKAVIRNTVYHNFHWRMYNDVPKAITKFT